MPAPAGTATCDVARLALERRCVVKSSAKSGAIGRTGKDVILLTYMAIGWATILAVMASLTALPVGIALLMPGSQRRSGGGRSIACCVLLSGAAANALMGVGCIALAVHFVSQGPALVFWFGVLPALLFGAFAFGFVR